MRVEEFSGSTVPPYAILSHCWGDGEVSFQDINGSGWRRKHGAVKIEYACEQAKKDHWDYVWIDTCCIDKRSSAELSEAINSMYNWYEEAQICYAYLEDVSAPTASLEMPQVLKRYEDLKFQKSKWFTRGWTLQELIAPNKVDFYGKEWNHLGTRKERASQISSFTRIPEKVLKEPLELEYCSVARRMSWAAGRQTTRVEDIAYCLMGLFDVHMPLLYGEGTQAFIRLQEEIIRTSDDQSVFAWDTGLDAPWDKDSFLDSGVLAGSPAAFADSGNIIPFPVKAKRQPYSMTNKGLRIELRLWLRRDEASEVYYIALLNCQLDNDFTGCIGIVLKETTDPSVFSRHTGYGSGLKKINIGEMSDGKMATIYIRKNARVAEKLRRYETCLVQIESTQKQGYEIVETRPRESVWNEDSHTLQIWANRRIRRHTPWAAFHFQNLETKHGFVVFVQISEANDQAWVKSCSLPSGGMTPHWLLVEVKAGFESSMNLCTLNEEGTGKYEITKEIKTRVWSTERLNQEIWILEVDMKTLGVVHTPLQ
jgi:hypothetical protein